LTERGASQELLNRIRTRLSAVNAEIASERDLGAGFLIGHSFFCPPTTYSVDDEWFREVIKSEIQPLLEEYFDSPARVEKLVSELLA
jgi:5-methylcytosine-specific restriction protein B